MTGPDPSVPYLLLRIKVNMDFDAYKSKVIRHEVGHWVVAKVLGYEVGEIAIRINQVAQFSSHNAHAHIDLHPSLRSINEIEQFLIDRISILWAGMFYQSTIDNRRIETIRDTDGANDYSKLRELCFILRGIRYPENDSRDTELEQMKNIADECWSKAKEIINTNNIACERLSKRISQRVTESNVRFEFNFDKLREWFDMDECSAEPNVPAD